MLGWLKMIPNLISLFKSLMEWFKKARYQYHDKQIEKGIEKAKTEKTTTDLQKEISKLLK